MIKKYYLFILVVILLFHLINNLIILKLDVIPPMGHAGLYYTHSINLYFTLLQNPEAFIAKLLRIDPIYPPLLYISPLPFYIFLGIEYDLATLVVNTLYLSILLFSLYLIGKSLFCSEVGLLSVFICSFFPAVFGYSRMFLMALPTVAILTLNIYLMIKSDCFKKRSYSLLSGFILGLGALMKKYYVVSFIGILIGYFFDKRNKIGNYNKKIFLNLFLALCIAAVIALPWYVVNIGGILSQLQEQKPIIFFNENTKIDFLLMVNTLSDIR